MQDITISWRFWLFWVLAFLGFPIAGLLANLIGAVTTPVRALGMAVGLAISTVLLGSETGGNELLWRAAITGLCMGIAQWIVLRQVLPQSIIWIGVMAVAWAVGWFVTRSAGIDLSYKWSVFGASGALVFQLLTGLALYFLFRLSQGIK